MDGGYGLFKFLFPQLPSLANTAILHSLGQTPTSSKWDLRTTLTVQVLREMMNPNSKKPPPPVSKVQATTLKDPGIKGKTWVAKATISAPSPEQEGLRAAVFKAIEEMKPETSGPLKYTKPKLADIEIEWTGFRPDAGSDEALPDIPEEEKYKKLLAEPSRTSDTTVLYFHGGAYYLCDPSTHRAVTSRVAKEAHGRVCSVRYRLAPQTAFPGQLLDALMVYLSLIYPPDGSMHEAVPVKNIVLAGDSAGGNLSFAFLQLLLQLHRTSTNPTARFHGKDVEIPLPAGASASSGWLDISRSMPSLLTNAQYDYLPPPKDENQNGPRSPPDHIWPASPPRGEMFCDLSLLDHPLTSPLAAESWENAPPLFLSLGQEQLADEDAIVASRAVSQGVTVQFEQYEAMPHVFAMLLPGLSTSNRCMRSWGDFCRRCVEDPGTLKTNGTFFEAKTGREESLDVGTASKISLDEARRLMRETKERRMKAFPQGEMTMPKSTL